MQRAELVRAPFRPLPGHQGPLATDHRLLVFRPDDDDCRVVFISPGKCVGQRDVRFDHNDPEMAFHFFCADRLIWW